MPDCRLIYKSIAYLEKVGPEELKALVARATERNEACGITGLLALFGDQFLQVLEGPPVAVNALYAKIVADERHRSVELVSYGEIATRSFPDWGMQIIDLADLPLEARAVFLNKYPSRDGEVVLPGSLPEIHALLFDARAVGLGRGTAGAIG